jgi:hypothetical protein
MARLTEKAIRSAALCPLCQRCSDFNPRCARRIEEQHFAYKRKDITESLVLVASTASDETPA